MESDPLPKVTPYLLRRADSMCTRRLAEEVEGGSRSDDPVNRARLREVFLEAVRNLHSLGVPFEDAVGAATEVPARVLRLPATGRLGVGTPADIVVLSEELEIERVLVEGRARVVG